MNGDGYSKLKQIVKENVKSVLSDNKILISTAFTALIHTLKADPEMVKLIHNIPTVNDGKQHKDDDNDNIIKFIEVNKGRIMDLAEKNYGNLVEMLTNNVMNTAASSSNPTLLLPQLSSTCSNPFDQIDTYKIEDPETYHNSKGDIAD